MLCNHRVHVLHGVYGGFLFKSKSYILGVVIAFRILTNKVALMKSGWQSNMSKNNYCQNK